jgi:hypothetical protein
MKRLVNTGRTPTASVDPPIVAGAALDGIGWRACKHRQSSPLNPYRRQLQLQHKRTPTTLRATPATTGVQDRATYSTN